MYIIIDNRAPIEAKRNLSKYGTIVEFKTDNIVYNSISGHPDIFITQIGLKYIVSPNIPEKYLNILSKVEFELGEKNIEKIYPKTVYYNCIVTENLLIHKKGYTDSIIIKNSYNKTIIDVPQAYTRCSTLALKDNCFITSDIGVYNKLKKNNFETIFVNPRNILLPGLKYGLFGGTAGILEDKIFFIGSLSYLEEKNIIRDFICSKGYKIIELYNGPLYDGGGIFFIPT